MSRIYTKAGEYSADVMSRFRESDGKLFLVDYSKSAAFDMLCGLYSDCGKPSLLFIVEDAGLAMQYKELMGKEFDGIHVISEISDIKSLIGDAKTPTALRTVAPQIKEKHKCLLIAAFDKDGKPVLNHEICRNDGKSGNFSGNDKASAYTFSDVLTESGYEFVAVDSVFDYLKFTSEDKEYKPGEDELVDFRGESYYANTARSYRRLNNLIDNSKYSLIMSDEMMDENAVSFYAVCELIRADFSLIDVRRKVMAASMDYSALCDMVNSIVLGAASDPDIVSNCLQRTRGFANSVPSDVYSMSSYLPRAFEFISIEEVSLKVVNYLVNHRGGGDFSRVDSVAESFGQDFSEIADCFVDILFKNDFKAEIEKGLRHSKVADMEREEITSLFAVLVKYGLYHWHKPFQNKPRLVRLFREDSGFEYIVRRLGRREYDADGVRCVLECGSEKLYKCAEVQRLLSEEESAIGITTPMLLVTRGDKKRIADCLRSLLPDCKVHTSDYKADVGAINIIDYSSLRKTPMTFDIKSVVYFDICYDISLMKLMMSRLADCGAPKQCIIAAGGTLDGLCTDVFEDVLLADIKALPILAPYVTIKAGLDAPYSEIVEKLNIVYESLQNVVENGHPDIIKEVSDKYNHMLQEYTNSSVVPAAEINMDIEFIARIGKFFTAIFANTVSAGEHGEEVVCETRKYEAVSKKGEKPEEKVKSETEHDFFFNVCPRVLTHACDMKVRNCGGCENYEAHMTNRYELLISNIDSFFEESYSYLEKMEKVREEKKMGSIINMGSGDDEEGGLDSDILKEYEENVRSAVMAIDTAGVDKKSFFVTDYETIEAIREQIYRPYRRMLRKYYKTVTELMQTASEKAKREIQNALDCTPSVEA